METTLQQKELLREIIRRTIRRDKNWLGENFILAGFKGSHWVLNYIQGQRNEYNALVRGMIIKHVPDHQGDELDLVVSFPFTRFYNLGEKEAAVVDFSNAEMLEKLDGTFVGIVFPHGDHTKPEFHTRKMFSLHPDDMARKITSFHGKEYLFLPTIKKYVDQLSFSEEDVDYTYVFEFIHEVSYVVTKYQANQYGLYLLGGRNIKTHRELTEDELCAKAKELGVRRPRRYDAVADMAEIEKLFKLQDTPDFEGFIFRDRKTGNRLKVKDPDYVKKHHLIESSSYKYLIPLILEGEEEEVIAYLPYVKPRVEEFKEAYERYLNFVTNKVLEWKAKGLEGRELAVTLFGENKLSNWEIKLKKQRGETYAFAKPAEPDEFVRRLILKYQTTENIRKAVNQELRTIALGKGNNNGDPKRLIEMLGLKDVEEVDTGEI